MKSKSSLGEIMHTHDYNYRRENPAIDSHFGCHGSDLAGEDGPAHDVVFETGILEVPQVSNTTPHPLLVLVASVAKLREHTYDIVKEDYWNLLEITGIY